MIRLVGRKLLFGTDEQYLGTTYDAGTGKRTFIRDRKSSDSADLSALSFYVLMNFKDGTIDMQDLEKSVTDDEITLIWNLSDTIFKHEGFCFIWVRAVDEQKVTRWSSEKAAVYITEAGSGDFSPSAADSAALEEIIKVETARVTAENARAEAETLRADAETERKSAETKRTEAETERNDAETTRAEAEVLRKANENDRLDNENLRAEAELKRQEFEDTRISSENTRIANENARNEAENARNEAENTRNENEADRVAAYNEFVTAKDELKSYATTSKSWAVGGTGSRDGEDTDNAKYYSSLAKSSETASAKSETNAATSEKNAAASAEAAKTSESGAQKIFDNMSDLANMNYTTSEQIDKLYSDGTISTDKNYINTLASLKEYDSKLKDSGAAHLGASKTDGTKTTVQDALNDLSEKAAGDTDPMLTMLRDSVANAYQNKTTTFNEDGSIAETLADGKIKTTVFNEDGSIMETLKSAAGDVMGTKATTFNSDGSITETVTNS